MPSPRPWSRRGSVCPSAKPGTVGTGMPRGATGRNRKTWDFWDFLGNLLNFWDRGTERAMICHDVMYDLHDLYDLRTKEVSQNVTSRHPYSPCNMNGVSLKFP